MLSFSGDKSVKAWSLSELVKGELFSQDWEAFLKCGHLLLR